MQIGDGELAEEKKFKSIRAVELASKTQGYLIKIFRTQIIAQGKIKLDTVPQR